MKKPPVATVPIAYLYALHHAIFCADHVLELCGREGSDVWIAAMEQLEIAIQLYAELRDGVEADDGQD